VRHLCALAAALALVALTGCSDTRDRSPRVIRLASAAPAGIKHDPAVAFFADRVARLSHGRLRVAVDERWAPGHEAQLLRDVARGAATLGWAHTSSLEQIGVRSFAALHAPMLVDGYDVEHAVMRGPLARQMLAGTRSVGLRGLALLSGPLSRLVGVGQAMRAPGDLRRLSFGVHGVVTGRSRIPQTTAVLATRALRAFREPMYHDFVDSFYTVPGRGSAAFEDDLDTLFFDRSGTRCSSRGSDCAALDPWVTTNVALWPRATVLVATPSRLHALAPNERAWIEKAASQAADYATTFGLRDEQLLVPELCAAGVRFARASRRDVAALRRALRTVDAQLDHRRRARRSTGSSGCEARQPATPRSRSRPGAIARGDRLAMRAACGPRSPTASTARGSPTPTCAGRVPTAPATAPGRRR
jgi:TRAP-type C4-dicarboxylate transport system substrate-binding protein